MKMRYAILAAAFSVQAACAQTGAVERIGVYDSRAVAMAYANSETHSKYIQGLKADMAKAQAEKNEARIKEISALGEGDQVALHKQVFSTGPIDSVLERIKDRIPAILKEAGVSRIVSQWDKTALDQLPSAEKVDVTMALVNEFHPSEKELENIKQLQNVQPIPIEEADKMSPFD